MTMMAKTIQWQEAPAMRTAIEEEGLAIKLGIRTYQVYLLG